MLRPIAIEELYKESQKQEYCWLARRFTLGNASVGGLTGSSVQGGFIKSFKLVAYKGSQSLKS